MAETERTWAELQALLADNTSEQISPQDLRDAAVSALGGYASIYVEANVASQAFVGTPGKLSCFASSGPSRGATPSPANDNVVVGVAGVYEVLVDLSGLAAVASVFDAAVFADGVAVPGLSSRVKLSDADERALAFSGLATLAAGAAIDVRLSCSPSTSATVRSARLSVKRVG